MASILIHVTVGPDNPTKAALAFLVAKTVVEEGHQLSLFVTRDGVHLLTDEVASKTEGVGTGRLSDHLNALSQGSFEAFYSGMSAKDRNITQDDIVLQGAHAAMPTKLVELTAGCDKVLCY